MEDVFEDELFILLIALRAQRHSSQEKKGSKKGKDVEIKTDERSQKRNEHKRENVDVIIDIEIVSSSLDFFVIFFFIKLLQTQGKDRD